MGFPLGEVLRISAIGIGAGLVPGVGGAAAAALAATLTGAANTLDKEDALDEKTRKRNEKRRKKWIDIAKKYEKLKALAGAEKAKELAKVIRADILQDEGRMPGEQEVNTYVEAVVAVAKL